MESSEETINGCVDLFFTVRKEFKLRCRYCDGVFYFSMNDYIEHWINTHKETLNWFSQPSSANLERSESSLPNQPTLVIKPSTRTFEINCTTCREPYVFDSVDGYITHFLENHLNSIKPQSSSDPATNNEITYVQAEVSDSEASLEHVTIQGDIEETTLKTLENFNGSCRNQEGLQVLHTSNLSLVLPSFQTEYVSDLQNSSFDCLLGTSSKELDSLRHTICSAENMLSNQTFERAKDLSIENTVLLRQVRSSVINDVVVCENGAQESRKQLEEVTVELVYHYHKTISSSAEVIHDDFRQSYSEKNDELQPKNGTYCSESVVCTPNTALNNDNSLASGSKMINEIMKNSTAEPLMAVGSLRSENTCRLLCFSQAYILSQSFAIYSKQKMGNTLELGVLKSYTIGEQYEGIYSENCSQVPNVGNNTKESSIEFDRNRKSSKNNEEDSKNDFRNIVNVCSVMNLAEYEETVSDKNTQENINESSMPRADSALSSQSNTDSERLKITENCGKVNLTDNSQNETEEMKANNESSRTFESASSTLSRSVSENSKPNTRMFSRKRKAIESDEANTARKKIAKETANPLYCMLCKKTFGRRSAYENHMKKCHPSLKCCVCNSVFESVEEMLHHLKQHSNDAECPVCRADILWYSKTHLKTHFDLLNCKTCQFFTCNKDVLKAHLKTCGELVCVVCDSTFKSANSYKRHAFKLHENSEPFECVLCEQKFLYLRSMKSHQRQCHQLEVD